MPLIDAHFGGFFLRDSIDYIQKTALDQVEYLKHLRRKNLEINNDIEVINHLNSISHFRLSAYMHTFYQPNDPEKKFIAGTNFNDVIKLYLFDKN